MKRTSRQFVLSAILLVVLSAIPAFAADITGTWTSQVKTNDGNELLLTFVFKQEGAKLTGTGSCEEIGGCIQTVIVTYMSAQ